ncbi:unnamed protein product [Somion occarium]|uniref:NmrA-like domain-containing protein n=1 Tax=Somion occarium TaxID=3059160 RepID=A0ABP1CXZ1_9APHY
MTTEGPMDRKILVTGATGKQGRALISSLRDSDFRILALTRNPSSPSALPLKSHPHVELVQGDLDKPETIRKIFEDAGGKGSIWGVFVVLAFPGLGANADGEEKQGIMMADLSLEYEVVHFVFSSVERGGETFDEDLILDRAAKVKIEKHVRSLGEKGLNWTILRPAFFMENLDGFIGRITFTVLHCGLKPDVKIQMAADDIGRLAAATFQNPQSSTHKIFVVTSDILTPVEMDAAYVRATGKHIPSIPNFLGRLLLAINSATKELIKDFERVHKLRTDDPNGYDAHLTETKAFFPELTSFEQWVKQRQNAKPTTQDDPNWNKVSIWKLVTGRL